MPEIIRITSEALQATVRRLLPSQQGFGDDLQASNVITPIIDLTPSAEGSALPYEMQTSLAFGSVTNFSVSNSTATVINTAGFYRCFGLFSIQGAFTSGATSNFSLNDGTTSKQIYAFDQQTNNVQNEFFAVPFDFTIFLRANDSLLATTADGALFNGCTRQIADVNGNLVDPSGFTPQ